MPPISKKLSEIPILGIRKSSDQISAMFFCMLDVGFLNNGAVLGLLYSGIGNAFLLTFPLDVFGNSFNHT